jgi:fructose-1-phosphate kinase PfkB-like protein
VLPAARAGAGVITTVTLNPAVDEAIAVDVVALGALNRCDLDAVDPGGKGLNASRVIARLGRDTVALGFVAGVTGALIRSRLDAERVPHAFDDVEGLTRINVMLLERRIARRTRLYLPGPRVTADDLERLRARLARPELIKPNVEEAVELLGRPIRDDAEALEAAAAFRALGAERVVISQGASGAIGVDATGAWKAVPPAVLVRSTVGSGDSMVAGLAVALSEGRGLAEGLRLGSAAGAATCAAPGTSLGATGDIERQLASVRVDLLRVPMPA